jgi:hypothetical protein
MVGLWWPVRRLPIRLRVDSFNWFLNAYLTTGGVAQGDLQGWQAIARQFNVELQSVGAEHLGALAGAMLRNQQVHGADVLESAGNRDVRQIDQRAAIRAAQAFSRSTSVCTYESASTKLDPAKPPQPPRSRGRKVGRRLPRG